jgi:hypothetical protein
MVEKKLNSFPTFKMGNGGLGGNPRRLWEEVKKETTILIIEKSLGKSQRLFILNVNTY